MELASHGWDGGLGERARKEWCALAGDSNTSDKFVIEIVCYFAIELLHM